MINTGTELLLGSVTNTHLGYVAQQLFPLGLRVARQETVPDGPAIREALERSFARCEVLLVTGGLGPTSDDITRELTAELLGRALREDADVLAAIAKRFERRGITMPARVQRQAMVPAGARVLANANGTAPGLYFEATSTSPHIFLLPGPPRELRPMFEDAVLPILRGLIPERGAQQSKTFRVAGLGESEVEQLVGEQLLSIPSLELGYCARPGEVDVRCIGPELAVTEAALVLFEALGARIYSTADESLEAVLIKKLRAGNATLAVVESCTGGLIANRLTNVPGASACLLEGLVTYSNESKIRRCGVPRELIEKHGSVSREVAAAMAEGALKSAAADHALATTGIAGPTGGSEEKPVGTVFIACASRGHETTVEVHRFTTDRETFKWLASQAALDLLRLRLAEDALL